MPSTIFVRYCSSPPLRLQAAIARRNWSGFAWREAGCPDGDLHHLLLEHGHTERSARRIFKCLARVGHWILALPSIQIRVNLANLNRPGAHDGDLDD
jgi:hypothetical protein